MLVKIQIDLIMFTNARALWTFKNFRKYLISPKQTVQVQNDCYHSHYWFQTSKFDEKIRLMEILEIALSRTSSQWIIKMSSRHSKTLACFLVIFGTREILGVRFNIFSAIFGVSLNFLVTVLKKSQFFQNQNLGKYLTF